MRYHSDFIDFCNTLSLSLTSVRKEVLYVLWTSQRPLKAYDILEFLEDNNPALKPPTVYRVLRFLEQHGIVYKIDSIQSYKICFSSHKKLVSEVLLVCDLCHQVIEVENLPIRDLIKKIAKESHFKLREDVVELKGICRDCQNISR